MPFFQQFPKTNFDFSGNGIDTKIVDLFRFVKAEEIYSDDLSVYTYYQVMNGDRPDVVSDILYGTPDYYWTFFILNEQLKSGISGWPMNAAMFDSYIDQEYSGTAIITRPEVVRDGFGLVIDYRNSLADRFVIDEQVVGAISGATGYVKSKDTQLSQLILRDVVGNFQANEFIIGQTSEDQVTSYSVTSYANAPHHYVDANGLISYNPLYIDEQVLYVNGAYVQNPIDQNLSNLTAVSNYEYELELNDQRSNIRVVRSERIYDFVKTFKEKINA
jgi:hypothetical protein